MNVRLGKERNVAVSKTIPASAAMASEESVLWLAQGSEGRKIPLRSEDARRQTGEGQRGPSNGEPAGPGGHDRQEMGHPSHAALDVLLDEGHWQLFWCYELDLHGGHRTAVDAVVGPVDKSRLLGGQERHERADLVDAAGAPELDVRPVVFQELPDGVFRGDPLLLRGLFHHRSHERGLDKGRAHRIDEDAVGGVLLGESLGEVVQGALGCAVGDHIRVRLRPVLGRNVDNPSPSLLLHRGTTHFTRSTAANRLSSKRLRHASSDVSSSVPPSPTVPALLTRMSMVPNPSTVSSTSRRRSAPSVRSATTASTRAPFAPAASISPAACRTSSSSREQIQTWYPSATRASATPRPTPLLPPVTSATVPSSARSTLDSFRRGSLLTHSLLLHPNTSLKLRSTFMAGDDG